MAVGPAKRIVQTVGHNRPAWFDCGALGCTRGHQVASLAEPHRGLRSDWLTPVLHGRSRGEL